MSFRLPASYISKAHTIFASSAFLCALFVGSRLHYRKIVKNEIAGYPDEWWPSVSATIGDWYPERSLFQIMIALTAGPRFILILCWWLLTRPTMPTLSLLVALCGLVRTLCCGGWVYITSSDDHQTHDFLMISYIVLNLPWMIGSILCTPAGNVVTRRKRYVMFFATIFPLVYFFVRHKVKQIPGAYTKYSFCEWFLIVADIWFDSFTVTDFSTLEVRLMPTTSSSTTPASRIFSDPKVTKVSSTEPTVNASLQNLLYVRFPDLQSWREVGSFSADVYLAYVWWSIFTVLAPSLFYFSVWQLSISGQEISLLSTLSPILLVSPSILSALNTHKGRTWMYLGCTVGLIAYITNYPLLRLLAVSLANVLGSIVKALEWSDTSKIERHAFVLTLGLIMASLSKLINHSVNPIWPIVDGKSGGWNKSGIFLALLAVWEYATRDLAENPDKAAGNPPSDLKGPFFNHWFLASTGLSGLLFSLHCFLADSDTLLANSWTGYPLTGPSPGIHGYLTLIAMAVGLFLSSSSLRDVVEHPIWLIYGALSSYFMYRWKNWPGYFAGLCLATFLSSLVPTMLRNAAFYGKNKPAKVYFTVWLFICLLDLANIWTVAYAFVPAGWLLRERTDIVLFIQMMMIFLGLVPVWRQAASRLTPSDITTSAAFIRYVRSSLALFVIGSILSITSRIPVKTPIPHHAAERLITAGIWTMHFGIDDEGRDSQYRMRDLIRDMELDIIGLLETDLHRIVFGNRDMQVHTRLTAKDLGYYVDIGPGPNSHTWGAALLSKFPILTSTHHLLPSPHGELAPAISAVLDVWGQNITVVVSHNGQEEDALDRELQSTELARIMAATYPEPVIFLGYVVTKPLAKRPNPYEILISDGMMHDIDDDDWDRWCEYILYRGVYRTGYARVSRSTITDTELQIGKFVIPKPGHSIVNASRDDRYLRDYREVFPSTMWFPDEFQDQINPGGVRGHRYHVHPWPLYYRLPGNAPV
ncbi:Frag1/DRAM/Sfk1 family-domain-containing protein [Hysterangium stoloniferum]|nr:Frag1/DRAM/Sfk1 family-domain-containing protein [Hysterangium stoloniferum]